LSNIWREKRRALPGVFLRAERYAEIRPRWSSFILKGILGQEDIVQAAERAMIFSKARFTIAPTRHSLNSSRPEFPEPLFQLSLSIDKALQNGRETGRSLEKQQNLGYGATSLCRLAELSCCALDEKLRTRLNNTIL
jgi:hypothetical protein